MFDVEMLCQLNKLKGSTSHGDDAKLRQTHGFNYVQQGGYSNILFLIVPSTQSHEHVRAPKFLFLSPHI